MSKLMALGLAALIPVLVAAQETRYVTDILQLGLFPSQEQSGAPISNLVSGTQVTVLERMPNYARVRTPDGQEGWVKSLYLIADKPARLRVAEVEARIIELEQELAATVAARDSIRSDTTRPFS